MRKIDYPIDITTFERDYYNSLLKTNELAINNFLSGIPLIPYPITFNDLVTAKFEDLVNYHFILQNYFRSKLPAEIKVFNDYFDYKTNQPFIANFFMSKRSDLELKTCFYCNIDFINSFDDFGEYDNELHYINTASIEELKIILGDVKAKLIYDALKIKRITDFDELIKIKGIGKATIDSIKLFKLNNLRKDKNHFTLDHFIPKGEFSYFALSLYNLIPSCYSCNTKFKGAMKFKDFNNLQFLSPSSNSFSLFKHLEFKLFFNVPGVYLKKKIKNTKILDDIRVDIENIGRVNEFDTYLDMFKLKGRYVFHKNESLKLIKKRKVYSDTEINEIARITNRNIEDIKKDIFGSSIFNDNEKNEPFAKYKKDIAKQLGIIP